MSLAEEGRHHAQLHNGVDWQGSRPRQRPTVALATRRSHRSRWRRGRERCYQRQGPLPQPTAWRSEMKALLVGVALLALTAPTAYAQSGSQEVPPPEMEGPGQYRVFFAFDRADLSQADRQVIAQAVDDYRRTGTARITATGHTDASG